MYIESVSIEKIRNIHQLKFTFSRGLVILHGRNGQGKTNVLEALSLLSHARSFRDARNEHLIMMEQTEEVPQGSIEARVQTEGRDIVIRVVIQPEIRVAFINGRRCNRLSELAGLLHFVIFSAHDLHVMRGSPSERRIFLDRLLFNLIPGYLPLLRDYMKVVQHRNSLLSRIREHRGRYGDLDVWDEQLIEHGEAIMTRRFRTIAAFNKLLPEKMATMTDVEENLQLYYVHSLCHDGENEEQDCVPAEQIRELFRKKIEQNRMREIERGYTLWGPQRDDFSLNSQGRNLRHFGSQGELRSALIALKLVEIDLFRQARYQHPIVLLDDVLSELDRKRCDLLLTNLDRDQQTFISATTLDLFQARMEEVFLINIEAGAIKKAFVGN